MKTVYLLLIDFTLAGVLLEDPMKCSVECEVVVWPSGSDIEKVASSNTWPSNQACFEQPLH